MDYPERAECDFSPPVLKRCVRCYRTRPIGEMAEVNEEWWCGDFCIPQNKEKDNEND